MDFPTRRRFRCFHVVLIFLFLKFEGILQRCNLNFITIMAFIGFYFCLFFSLFSLCLSFSSFLCPLRYIRASWFLLFSFHCHVSSFLVLFVVSFLSFSCCFIFCYGFLYFRFIRRPFRLFHYILILLFFVSSLSSFSSYLFCVGIVAFTSFTCRSSLVLLVFFCRFRTILFIVVSFSCNLSLSFRSLHFFFFRALFIVLLSFSSSWSSWFCVILVSFLQFSSRSYHSRLFLSFFFYKYVIHYSCVVFVILVSFSSY